MTTGPFATESHQDETIQIGPFVVGEIPGRHLHSFQDDDGNPLDFSVGTWKATLVYGVANTMIEGNTAQAEQLAATVEADGDVSWTWDEDSFDTGGFYYARLWVYNAASFAAATERWASPTFTFWVIEDHLPQPTP